MNIDELVKQCSYELECIIKNALKPECCKDADEREDYVGWMLIAIRKSIVNWLEKQPKP